MRIPKTGIAAMSEGTPGDGLLADAAREYGRLLHDARPEGQPWNQEATLDGLLIKPVAAMYPLDCSQ